MVRGMFKSRTFRRVFVKTPGSNTVIHYRKRKPSSAKCGECRGVLSGIPRVSPSKMKNLAKTEKRPQRPYGGALCSMCTKTKIKLQVRQ